MISLRLGILLSCSLILLIGCRLNDDSQLLQTDLLESRSEETTSLTFVISPWPPDAIHYLTQKRGLFEKHNVDAQFVSIDDYDGIFKQLEKGNLIVWTGTLPEVIKYVSEKEDSVIVYLEDISRGADALVTLNNDEIQSVSDLVGKRVGVELDAVGGFFLQVLLDRQQLELSVIELIDTASADIFEKLQAGDIDVGVCYEPCPTRIIYAGGHVIVDSAREKGLIVDVYVVNKKHLQENLDLYVRAFTAISEGQAYFNEHPQESMEIMKEILNLSTEEIAASFVGIDIPTINDNVRAFDRSSGFNSVYNQANVSGKYLEYQDLIEVGYNTDQIIDTRLIDIISREPK